MREGYDGELTENNILLQDGETFINKSTGDRKKIIFSISQ